MCVMGWIGLSYVLCCKLEHVQRACYDGGGGGNGRAHLKCDGTRAETRFHLSAKRTSTFKSAGVSVQSTTCSQGVRISGSNAGYTVF